LLFTESFRSKFPKIIERYKIEVVKQPKVPNYALKSYELNDGPVEKMLTKHDAKMILKQYSLLGRQCYIDVVYTLTSLGEVIAKECLFEHPVQYQTIYPLLTNDK
jgi:hypothetical protein